MNLLDGKVALITGGSRGIGKGIAIAMAQQGAAIAFTATSLSEKTLETEKELLSIGCKVKAYASNAADLKATENTVSEVLKDFGQIDILVNNAGITKDTLMLRMSEEQWDDVIATNLKSVFNYTKAVQKTMLKQRAGSIINMSSVVGINGNAGQANYAASKAGIIGFTKSIAKEFGARGIRANVIAPGFIQTEMTEKLPDSVKSQWIDMVPLKRFGDVKDVANTVIFLASDMSAYITGQTISVCGGMI
ncbi:3-oxoacyl-[acyl-carrier-protein] reductase [Balneicella halophila]|uniref:3-oxoacyl-[acyl-carrier-protein] reductase n=1 Tax=Balneicella halophila TaxID=1537566 RepID=A0A7L4UQ72_BALHA|nr:3-oxoacyl-[acyl-carrier-protein] reductase [Balneicella halophila]PVX51037.1 3-oxoacyl-[acyl-carrier-protein] reductase [Balneicella halophila]